MYETTKKTRPHPNVMDARDVPPVQWNDDESMNTEFGRHTREIVA